MKRSPLTDDQVRAVRQRYDDGAAQVDLAVEFGVSQGHISMLVTGRRRREAGGPIRPRRPYNRRKAG